MLKMPPYSKHCGIDTRMQLHKKEISQFQPDVYDHFVQNSTPEGRYSTSDAFDSSSYEYRIQHHNHQTHQKLVSTKPEVLCHTQAPRTSLFQGMQFLMGDYTYPTLNVLYNGSNPLHTANDNGILHGEYEQRSTSGKQAKTEKLHPFYKRQHFATFGDGMTRTRDKYRVVYTEKQKKLLEDEYKSTRFLTNARRVGLVKEAGLSERQIKFWFQNRRAKDKRNRTSSKRDNKSSNATSEQQRMTKDNQSVETDCKITTQKEEIIASCKYIFQNRSLEQKAIPSNNGQVEHQYQPSIHLDTVSPVLSNSCKYSTLLPSISPTHGSCRYENEVSCFEEKKISPTGRQNLRQYPVSPSEFTFANQQSYFINSMALSPLFNGLQYGNDYRL